MRAMWSGERRGVRFDGRYYQLAGVHPGPAPAHPIQVWIGANRPRALALTGRVADGWVSPADVLQAAARSRSGKPRDRSRRPRGGPRPARDSPHLQRPGRVHEHDRGACGRHRPGRGRPTRALGGGSDAPRARARLRHVRARHPARPATRSRPSSRTSPRRSANGSPRRRASREAPQEHDRAGLRGPSGNRPRADAVPGAARGPRADPPASSRQWSARGRRRRRAAGRRAAT